MRRRPDVVCVVEGEMGMAKGKARHFDVTEVILIMSLVAVAVWTTEQTISRPLALPREAEAFAKKYGPDRNSEHEEEWLIRDFFGDRRGGFFVDVGANHYKLFSNTYYLDAVLGWSGIAIEPQRGFEGGYTANRPRTKFRPFFVSDQSNEQATMYVLGKNALVTSADKDFTERYGKDAKEVTAPTITLNDLLDSEHVPSIDFMTMDIELWEPKALAGFDVERFKPQLVCVEAHPEVRQQILDYFARHHYVVVGKYLRLDTQNLYFTPMAAATASLPQQVERHGKHGG
jgi:FkbM family methyltransferase